MLARGDRTPGGGCDPGRRDRLAAADAGRGVPGPDRRRGAAELARPARPSGAHDDHDIRQSPQPSRRTPGIAAPSAARSPLRALRKYFRTPGPEHHGHRPVRHVPVQLPLRLRAAPSTLVATSYVDFLVPSYVASIVLFTGGGIAVAVAEDKAEGFTDRLLSLPVSRYSLVLGRTLADSSTNVWSILTTAAFGFAVRIPAARHLAGRAGRPWPVRAVRGRLHGRVHRDGAVRAERPGRAGDVADRVRVRVHLQRVCAGHLDAGLAAAVLEVPADHPHGRRGPVAAGRVDQRCRLALAWSALLLVVSCRSRCSGTGGHDATPTVAPPAWRGRYHRSWQDEASGGADPASAKQRKGA